MSELRLVSETKRQKPKSAKPILKAKDQPIDRKEEPVMSPSMSQKENVRVKGVPDFNRYISREKAQELTKTDNYGFSYHLNPNFEFIQQSDLLKR